VWGIAVPVVCEANSAVVGASLQLRKLARVIPDTDSHLPAPKKIEPKRAITDPPFHRTGSFL
jgi:hypothetical protein